VKAGDWVREKRDSRYGIIIKFGSPHAQRVLVLWQGMDCSLTWVWDYTLVAGVEDELLAWKGAK
jgi:hypothetical protein|tara:strand:- start:1445 stop:1636 length:192 start_codon:yes stop_codon:yes gene_type:complete